MPGTSRWKDRLKSMLGLTSPQWIHREALVQYGSSDQGSPTNVEIPIQAQSVLSDWNRYARQDDTLLINGKKCSELLPALGEAKHEFDMTYAALPKEQQKNTRFSFEAFKNMGELRDFLHKNLFPHVDSADDPAITHALNHFNQGGLLTATSKAINLANLKSGVDLGLSEPKSQIIMTAEPNGVYITERNVFNSAKSRSTGQSIATSELPLAESQSSYLMTLKGDVEVLTVAIKCKNADIEEAITPAPVGPKLSH
jgi:hypothetical protein